MNRDLLRLNHMLDGAMEIVEFTNNKARKDLDNRLLNLAIVHLLEIIGEAANGISEETKNKYQGIPWYALIGMRNRLIHGYFNTDLDVVWETTQTDIPDLIIELKKIIKTES